MVVRYASKYLERDVPQTEADALEVVIEAVTVVMVMAVASVEIVAIAMVVANVAVAADMLAEEVTVETVVDFATSQVNAVNLKENIKK